MTWCDRDFGDRLMNFVSFVHFVGKSFSAISWIMNKKTAEIVVACAELGRALEFFETHGFRLEMIMPADAPTVAVVSGFGVRLRLEESAVTSPLTINLSGDFDLESEVVSPDGVRLRFTPATPTLPKIVNELVVSLPGAAFHEGRAGMLYRDLLPTRLGGAFIASHIAIPNGGPIADYVHFHKIRFQMLHALAGRALLVYEDQGAPFWFEAGDTILQPPEIRHRVLEASDGFEVVEIGAPAIHETYRDHEMTLPNDSFAPEREFGGQRFVHHKGVGDIGISAATGGLADVRVITLDGRVEEINDREFLFYFIAEGIARLFCSDGRVVELAPKSAINLPPGESFVFDGTAKMLRVML